MLYRLFPWDPAARAGAAGGPLFSPRSQQGGGRHDNPALYGAIYASRSAASAIAEWLAVFRGQSIELADLERTDGRRLALAELDDSGVTDLIELDEPAELVARELRPSGVATYRRSVTQRLAANLFDEGRAGFGWWSTLEASWSNVTLFAERSLARLAVVGDPRPVAFDDLALRQAATAIGVRLSSRGVRLVRR